MAQYARTFRKHSLQRQQLRQDQTSCSLRNKRRGRQAPQGKEANIGEKQQKQDRWSLLELVAALTNQLSRLLTRKLSRKNASELRPAITPIAGIYWMHCLNALFTVHAQKDKGCRLVILVKPRSPAPQKYTLLFPPEDIIKYISPDRIESAELGLIASRFFLHDSLFGY